MTDTYKATPEQWRNIEESAWGRNSLSKPACLLELRARVKALEAQASNYPEIPDSSTPPPVATDEELKAMWNVPGTNLDVFRACYNLGVAHGQAGRREVVKPAPVAGGSMEQALAAVTRFYAKGHEDCTEQEVRDDYDTIRRALEALPE